MNNKNRITKPKLIIMYFLSIQSHFIKHINQSQCENINKSNFSTDDPIFLEQDHSDEQDKRELFDETADYESY